MARLKAVSFLNTSSMIGGIASDGYGRIGSTTATGTHPGGTPIHDDTHGNIAVEHGPDDAHVLPIHRSSNVSSSGVPRHPGPPAGDRLPGRDDSGPAGNLPVLQQPAVPGRHDRTRAGQSCSAILRRRDSTRRKSSDPAMHLRPVLP